MAVNYKHGIYSENEKSGIDLSTKSLGTVPVYIGSLPVHRINKTGEADFDYSPYVGKPILISSYKDVEKMGIYSDDWDTYTLCEAIHAHFMNGEESVSPIIVVNILDPEVVEEKAQVRSSVFVKEGKYYIGYIEDSKLTLDDISFTLTEADIDKTKDLEFEYVGDKLKITIKKSVVESSTPMQVTYKQIKFYMNSAIGEDFGKILRNIDMSEMLTGYIPNIICAPKISVNATYHDQMVQYVSEKIADKWGIILVSDCGYSASDEDVVESAINWKKTNAYNSKFDKVCFPYAKKGDKIYHLSVLTTLAMQKIDTENDGVPYVSPSNKPIIADAVVLADGTPFFMRESEANKLNEEGITTINVINRQLRLWGSHMANYYHETKDNIPLEERSDCNIRTSIYLANMLQHDFIDEIDTPFSRKDVDSIKTSIQQRLNALVNEGKLIYAVVEFNEDSNSEEDIANGDITFDVKYTLTPNVKSITLKLRYTTTGLTALLEGSEF